MKFLVKPVGESFDSGLAFEVEADSVLDAKITYNVETGSEYKEHELEAHDISHLYENNY